jgi:iron complex transport system ATP-binding protein
MKSSLAAHAVTFRIGAKALLADASFALEPGQVCGVVGLNGAGKSTLLRCLTGELAPTSGAVELNGRPLREWGRRARAQRLAVLAQESQVDFPLTVLEIVLLGRAPHIRLRESKRDYAIATETLAAMDVAHLAEREYPSLSGGEKQRVQLARVLAQLWQEEEAGAEPRYLLLDEPTSSLDLIHQHRVMQIVLGIAARGVGILIILHDLNLASRYTRQLLVLKEGRILAQGATREILQPELVRDAFGVRAHLIPHPEADHFLVVPA